MNILEENLHLYLTQLQSNNEASQNEKKPDSKSHSDSVDPFLKILPFDWELEHDSLKISENNIDLILCSDCLYNSIVVEPLIRVIQMVSQISLLLCDVVNIWRCRTSRRSYWSC